MAWLAAYLEERLPALLALQSHAFAAETPPQLRAFLAPLVHGGGCLPRAALAETLALLQPPDRKALRRMGITVGSLSIFHPGLLKPGPTRLRLALLAVQEGRVMPPVPMPGLGLLDKPSPDLAKAAVQAGYDRFGEQMLRHDLVERLALALHDQRQGHAPFLPDRGLATRLGVGEATLGRILRALGFVPAGHDAAHWRWRGLKDRGNPQSHRPPRAGGGDVRRSADAH
jgi:ATP-dependent RNA helicase SUPV3L1/SUV3